MPASPSRWNTLRLQFTGVIFALTFLPNLALSALLSQWHFNRTLLLWTALVGAFCGLTGYFLSGLMLRPLLRLRAEASSGDFGAPHADDPLEVRALRSAFTGLLNRLDTEQARRHAFMATLVHDLKTPLIAVGHLTRLLIAGHLSAPERQEVGNQMLSENERLLTLVQQMADAHRFEREDVKLSVGRCSGEALLLRLEQRLRETASQRGLQLRVLGSGELCADSAALERALGNLADNALRYAGGQVYLLLEKREGDWWLGVADDGPGLAQPLSALAQPFNAQPITLGGQQYTAGTAGLGLFIARRIAEAHGGQLRYCRAPLPKLLPSLSPQLPRARDEGAMDPFTLLAVQLPASLENLCE